MVVGLGETNRRQDPTATPIANRFHPIDERLSGKVRTGTLQALDYQHAENVTIERIPIGGMVGIVAIHQRSILGETRFSPPFRITKVAEKLFHLESRREPIPRIPVITEPPHLSQVSSQTSSDPVELQSPEEKNPPPTEQDFLKQALSALDDL